MSGVCRTRVRKILTKNRSEADARTKSLNDAGLCCSSKTMRLARLSTPSSTLSRPSSSNTLHVAGSGEAAVPGGFLMHQCAKLLSVLLCLPLLAGCNNSPSDYDVDVCTRNKINQRVETASGPLICGEYVEVLGVNVADYQLDGNTARVVANMRWRARKAFRKSGETASMCFVSVRDPEKSYRVDEVTVSKFNVVLEKLASGWKCKS